MLNSDILHEDDKETESYLAIFNAGCLKYYLKARFSIYQKLARKN